MAHIFPLSTPSNPGPEIGLQERVPLAFQVSGRWDLDESGEVACVTEMDLISCRNT